MDDLVAQCGARGTPGTLGLITIRATSAVMRLADDAWTEQVFAAGYIAVALVAFSSLTQVPKHCSSSHALRVWNTRILIPANVYVPTYAGFN